MTEWNAGYMTDIGYSYGYYPELNPLWQRLAFLHAGVALPKINTACELGFGQGVSVNIHSAASGVDWWGTDFNPEHVVFAQELANASGAKPHLFDSSFADFCNQPNLPDFDYIGLHGIWTWISDENRAVIVDFIRRKLKFGGVLYISYYVSPGWVSMFPLRDLLIEHAQRMSTPGQGMVNRIDGALHFAQRVMELSPMLTGTNPQVVTRLNMIKNQNRNYLAHEYFNRDWQPISFAKMAEWLEPAKLTYVCASNYIDNLDLMNLTAQQIELLNSIPDIVFRETVRDFIVGRQFRRECWIKGVRRLSPVEQTEALLDQRVMLVMPRSEVLFKGQGLQGEFTIHEKLCTPILDLLADHQPKTIGQIVDAMQNLGINLDMVRQIIMVLIGSSCLQMVQPKEQIDQTKATTKRFNDYVLNRARYDSNITFLASPVTGGGVSVPSFSQLFLLARATGHLLADDWAAFAWKHLSANGQMLVTKDGKTLTTLEENLAELSMLARIFQEKQLPILQAMQLA